MPLTEDTMSPECHDAGWLNSVTPSVHHRECSKLGYCSCRCHSLTQKKAKPMTPFSPRVQSRLWNWKFSRALEYLHGDDIMRYPHTESQEEVIAALASMFGDCGYFYGSMSDIIRGAVSWLLGMPADVPEGWLPEGIREEYEAEKRSRSIHPSTGQYAAETRNLTLERHDTRPWGDEA